MSDVIYRCVGVAATAICFALIPISPTVAQHAAAQVVRGPYLQMATPDGVQVRWRTDLPTATRLLVGLAEGDLFDHAYDPTPVTEHVVTLEGLPADTQHYYAVADDNGILAGDDSEHFFFTAPLAGTPRPTRIWVLGDSGTGDSAAMTVRDAYYAFAAGETTDLWLMLGDNAYPWGTDAQYQLKLFDIYPEMLRTASLWPTIGNHDAVSSESSTQTGPYFDIFSLPTGGELGGAGTGTEAYYSFDFANIHFVVLDSQGTSRDPGSAMLTWLASDLASTAQDWVIAFWHHPPYSKGSHDSDAEQQLAEMRENVVPILEDHGVDLVLSGHSHSYERSYLLDGHYGSSGELFESMVLDPGDGRADGDGVYFEPIPGPDPHRGAVYTVAGCSGKLSGGPFDHPAMKVSLLELGSLVVDIDGDRLDAAFLDAAGQVRDSFTIVKGCDESGPSFSSLNASSGNSGSGSASYVYTPGLCDDGPPCSSDIGSSVSSGLGGSFWLRSDGISFEGAGTDSGSAEPLDPGSSGWVRTDPGSAAFIEGHWSPANGQDGCIGLENDTACMAMILADQNDSVGYFAALTATADASDDYWFHQPKGAPIDLLPIPTTWITGSASLNAYTKEVDLTVFEPEGGRYGDGSACDDDPMRGFKIYRQDTGRSDPPPDDREISSGWSIADGGELHGGEPIPFGEPTTITLTCYTAISAYLGVSLVFESGFELPLVSETPSYILCSNCETDDDQDGSCAMWITGSIGPDCEDSDPTQFPDGPQLCGDWVNNDCDHPSWPGLEGTNEDDGDGDGATECDGDCSDGDPGVWGTPGPALDLRFRSDKQTATWDAPLETGGDDLRFDLIRSAEPSNFLDGATCVVADAPVATAVDADVPPSSSAFFYLVRPQSACGAGSMGSRSSGTERSGATCP